MHKSLTDTINEIADEKFLASLTRIVEAKLELEKKKIGKRKCVHCGKTPRPRFLIGSDSCDHCYETGAGCGD